MLYVFPFYSVLIDVDDFGIKFKNTDFYGTWKGWLDIDSIC